MAAAEVKVSTLDDNVDLGYGYWNRRVYEVADSMEADRQHHSNGDGAAVDGRGSRIAGFLTGRDAAQSSLPDDASARWAP